MGPVNLVIANVQSDPLEGFVDTAFTAVGLDWREYFVQDRMLFRPSEIGHNCGGLGKPELGWKRSVAKLKAGPMPFSE